MTNPLEPNANHWGLPPNLARKFEPATDLVSLVVWNMNLNTGMSFKTSRPFPAFLRLASRIVTGISEERLNLSLSNLMRAGACILERVDGYKEDRDGSPIRSLFMFYLEYEDSNNLPVDEPHEVDPKQAVRWVEELDGLFGLEAMRIRNTKTSEPNRDGSDITGFIEI